MNSGDFINFEVMSHFVRDNIIRMERFIKTTIEEILKQILQKLTEKNVT